MPNRPTGVLHRTDLDPPAAPWVTPRVRQLATEAGVDLSALVGTGIGGRIRPSDLTRAKSHISTTTLPANRSLAVVEIDVTDASDDLLPALVRAVASAAEVAVLADGRPVGLPDVDQLNTAGIARRLAAPPPAAEPTPGAVLVATGGELLAAPHIPGWDGPVLVLGAPVRRPAVVRVGDVEAVAVRDIAYLTLSHDPATFPATAATRLLTIVTRPGLHGSAGVAAPLFYGGAGRFQAGHRHSER